MADDISELTNEQRATYVYRRLAIRRRMAVTAFIILVFGGAALIGCGVAFEGVAKRIASIGVIVATFMTTLAGMVSVYWGAGAYEHGDFFSSGPNGMTAASYSGTPPVLPGTQTTTPAVVVVQPENHAHLEKHPKPAG
jgi:hypothetical protein